VVIPAEGEISLLVPEGDLSSRTPDVVGLAHLLLPRCGQPGPRAGRDSR
jgi:hypothetical protein